VRPATTSAAKPVYQIIIPFHFLERREGDQAADRDRCRLHTSMGLPMRNNASGPGRNEHRIIRTWRIGVVAFYASILAILISLSAVGDRAIRIASAPASSTFETASPR
jgi:hypothetical protein